MEESERIPWNVMWSIPTSSTFVVTLIWATWLLDSLIYCVLENVVACRPHPMRVKKAKKYSLTGMHVILFFCSIIICYTFNILEESGDDIVICTLLHSNLLYHLWWCWFEKYIPLNSFTLCATINGCMSKSLIILPINFEITLVACN